MATQQDMIRLASGTPVWVSGTGRTVIFIHGVLVDHRMWQAQVEALSPHYRVCCIDMLGHGDAPDPPGERVLADFVEQADEVVEHFADQGAPVLAGFSMGGLIAQAYAIRHHSKLGGLILMNTVHDRSLEQSASVLARFEGNVTRGVENAVESGARRWFKERDYETHADEIRQTLDMMRDGDFTAKRKAHRVFVTSDGELTGKLGAISCPALVMTGAEDAGSTPEMAQMMASAIPDAQLHILDGQHHLMPVLDAARVNAIVLDFLSRHIRT
ncbi:MAG: alpha/beta fold hydrolase [Rhizobiales bacterium]|nr:alpha/beta fold hydrolase [Hyphomicrobiales bacterium]